MEEQRRQVSPDSNPSQASAISKISDAVNTRISILKESIQEAIAGDATDEHAKHFIIDSLWFHLVVIAMTLANSAQMGFEAEYPDSKQLWEICEIVFTTGFLVEMILKLTFMKLNYFKDPANFLDCSLVVLGVMDFVLSTALGPDSADLQALSILRILRLARLARILKLVRAFKPLVLVIRGLAATMTTLMYVFALLMLMIYVAAILLKESLGKPADADLYPGYSTDHQVIDTQEVMLNYNPAIYFGSMWLSMITLFNMATFNEWQEVVRPIALRQPAYVLIFLCYAMIVAFGVMNVMTGLIVDSVIAEAKAWSDAQDDNLAKERLQNLEKVQTILADMDLDPEGTIDSTHLSAAMENDPVLSQLLRTIDLPSAWTADELLKMLDDNGDGALQKCEFTTSFFRLLESNHSHFQQVCILQASINQAKRMVNAGTEDIQRQLLAMQAELRSIKSVLCPAAGSQAQPATHKTYVSEKFAREPRKEQFQQCINAESEISLDEVTPGVFNELEDRIQRMSHTLLIESLDEAYTVMRESFKEELTSLTSRAKIRFTEGKQIRGDPADLEVRYCDCRSRPAETDAVPQAYQLLEEAPTVLVDKHKSFSLSVTEVVGSVGAGKKRSILEI